MYDLRHAYHMIRTSKKEKHLRRILFRFNKNQQWQEYTLNRVTFGDLIMALTLEFAMAIHHQEGCNHRRPGSQSAG